MTAAGVLLGEAVVVLLGAWAVAFRLVPGLLRRATRGGFRPDPLTARRLQRFRSMRWGYGAFVLMVSALVASLFLEVLCNERPLYIRYQEHVQYPALVNWVDFWVPFIHAHDDMLASNFGEPDEGSLDAREYSRWVHHPDDLEAHVRSLEDDLRADEARFRSTLAADAGQRGLRYDPATPLPAWKIKEQETTRERAAALRRLESEIRGGGAAVVMPMYPYSPQAQLLKLPGAPPHAPFQAGLPVLGTDAEGRDVLSQLLYGFRLSVSFGLVVTVAGYVVGVLVGAAMGYYGGWFDIVVQRLIDIWGSIPFLYVVMIIASVTQPGYWKLVGLFITLQAWVSITNYERGEFYREKVRDYVQAARAIGLGDGAIMVRHILPNALVPVVTFLPFDVVGFMSELVALDFLGFGMPPGTPSWGALLQQGAENITSFPHLIYIPVLAFAGTLYCVVLIGEAVREAFDPKKYARLR